MEITVIGSGSSGNSYFVQSGEKTLLLDAGLPIQRIQAGTQYGLSKLAGALITHSHNDHSKCVRELMRYGVHCYMPSDTINELGLNDGGVSTYAHSVDTFETIDVGGWRVKAFPLEHDVTNYGYIVDDGHGNRLVYITDTSFCRYRIHGMTHLLIEANHSREILLKRCEESEEARRQLGRLLRSHMAVETTVKFLQANDLSNLRRLWLIHLSDRNSDAADFKCRVQAVTGVPVIVA